MQRLALVLLVGVSFVLAGVLVTAVERPATKRKTLCVAITGTDSRVRVPRYYRITSAKVWTRIWQEHKEGRATDDYDLQEDRLALPVIDFDNYMVIAIFQGEGWNSKGLSLVSLFDWDKQIVLRYANKSYQTLEKANEVTAYAFFVLPRFGKPIIVEENVQGFRGAPPIWRERPLSKGRRS